RGRERACCWASAIALAGGEIYQLEGMTFRVVKLDRLYTGPPPLRRGGGDWMSGNLPHIGLLSNLLGSIPIADHDGHMLEPGIVAVGPNRDEPSGGRRDILGDLDRLLAKVQLHDAHVGVEYADQGVVLAADDAKIGKLLELQHVDEEVRRAL